MKPISKTAFLANESKARRVDISKDVYAHLWVSDETRKVWESFTSRVYPYDDVELAVRNRFFLERMTAFCGRASHPIIVNIGAGFTSYPFLLPDTCECVEVDLEHVIGYKREKITRWTNEKELPDRLISFIAIDLTSQSGRAHLKEELAAKIARRPSFILLEGLTYYLPMGVLINLLGIFSAVQEPESVVAFDFWEPKISEHPVFLMFKEFWEEYFGVAKYNLFDVEFLESIEGYNIAELTNVQEQEKVFSENPELLDYNKILPENYTVLKRV